jgi:antitoxin (DNA-binding transcriptional repressor) of toxin-antitoxin stability system
MARDVKLRSEPVQALKDKAGKPMARLSPISAPARKKHLGLLKGRIKVADDFNMPLDDAVLGLFEGR